MPDANGAPPRQSVPYRHKVVTPDGAMASIGSRQRVFMTANCSVPRVLQAALLERVRSLEGVELTHVLTIGLDESVVSPELEGHLRVNTLFISPNLRTAIADGRADFTPCFLSEIPRLFRERLPLDVALIHVTPPDADGWCSFGVEVGVTKPAAEAARVVIAEVNPRMPRTLGDAFIHVSAIDAIVEVDYPVTATRMAAPSEVSRRIAAHIAALVPDGATLQTGIGGIPDAVLERLTDHAHLGIHTELFSDGIIDLVERGVIDGARKTLHPGKIVAGFMIGTKRLYDFVHENPVIEMHTTDYVNDPFVVAQNDRMVAINSAIEVDLTGQVCADSLGTHLYSGVGGQLDFIYGASRSKGGVPIIAMPSTAAVNGASVSRIVPTLREGAGVVTTRNHAVVVVTEHGVADLRGRSIRQRARALIDIAAPEFHAQLEAAAARLRYL